MLVPTDQLATIGHNGAPVEPFEAIAAHILGLFELAASCLHGGVIDTPERASAIDGIIDDIRLAEKALETERKTLVKPFDTAKAEIQALAKPLAGKLAIAKQTALDAVAPFRRAQEAIREADAKAKRDEADRLQQEALAAFQTSNVNDLDARAIADELADAAKKAEVAANRIDRTATGLVSRWSHEVTDYGAAIAWLKQYRPAELKAAVDELVRKEFVGGRRVITGVLITMEKVAR
jgi:hypothetical protein